MTQAKVGWRPYVATTTTTASTLLTSIYGVWNADTTSTVTTLNTNTFAAWNGESNTNDSLGNYNGTNNGVTYTTGKIGTNTFSFNGSSNFIALPQSALNFNKGNTDGNSIGDFSVSFWLNLNTGSGDYQTVIGNWGDNGFGWQVVMFGGNFTFFGSDGTLGASARINHSLSLSKANATNQWVHVVVTYTNQSQVKSYVNGVLTNTTSTIYQIRTNSRNNGNLGCWPQSGDNSSTKYWFLNGKLDAVTLWTKALTEAEASALYNNGTGLQYSFPSSVIGYTPSPNDAVSTNHGTLMNGTTFTTGKIGQAFQFDGVNDMVTLPNNSLNINGDFSASAWVKYTIGSGIKTILSNNALLTSPTRQYGWGLYLNSNNILFQTYDSTSTVGSLFYTATLTSGTWYHITVTKSGTTKRIYLNGTEVANASVNNITYTATHRPTIGGQRYDATGMEYFSVSPIDEVNVWTKELTSTEVTELYNSGTGKQYPYVVEAPSSLLTNLYAIYKGENNANDSLGTYNGTAQGGLTYSAGKSGNAFAFNGTNAYVSLPTNQFKFTTDFSINVWSNFSGGTNNVQAIFSNLTGDGIYAYGYYLYYYNNTLTFQISNNSGSFLLNYTTGSLFNSWNNIVITRKLSTGTKMYINGTLVASNSNVQNPNYHATMTPSIGATNYGPTFANLVQYYASNGSKIDELNVWTKELTSTEVTTLYNSGAGKFYPTF